MSQSITIKDNSGRDYTVHDPDRFYQHIQDYHARGVSVHEENGYYFTVDDAFRKMVDQLFANDN